MKDGDIYFWRLKEVAKPGPFGSYHCRSQKAVARNGKLYDTFWSGQGDESVVPLDGVELDYKGNTNEMQTIRSGEINYYRPEDIVDMRHSNFSGAKVYVQVGAERNADIMLAYLQTVIDEEESKIVWARRTIATIEAEVDEVQSGLLDKVYH